MTGMSGILNNYMPVNLILSNWFMMDCSESHVFFHFEELIMFLVWNSWWICWEIWPFLWYCLVLYSWDHQLINNPGGPNLPFGLGRYERNYFFGSGYETVLILQTCFEPVYKPVQELAFSLERVQLKNLFFCLKNGLKLK